jgi:hypothetical protein
MWSAFECSMFATMSATHKDEIERLFKVGYEAGRQLLEAAKNHEIPPNVIYSEVPAGVSERWQGPTIEFGIGRVFEAAQSDAYEKVVSGIDEGYKTDKRFQQLAADKKFQQGNCHLIRLK